MMIRYLLVNWPSTLRQEGDGDGAMAWESWLISFVKVPFCMRRGQLVWGSGV